MILPYPVSGALNNSISINIVVVSLLSQAFNSSEGDFYYSQIGDFDCSTGVSILDISIFTESFSHEGVYRPIIYP